MSHYIDGFVFPIARSSLDTYKQLAEQIAEIWKEYGALEYKEFMGDDMSLEGTRSFIDSTAATDDEVVVMGWVRRLVTGRQGLSSVLNVRMSDTGPQSRPHFI